MKDMLYSASDIAVIICGHDLGIKEQTELLQQVWAYDRMYLETSIRDDMKKLFTDVQYQCHYYYDKVAIDSEFPMVKKDVAATGGNVEQDTFVTEFENIDLFFKNMRYRILFLEHNDYVKMKIRTLMKAYGYRRRSQQLIDHLKECLSFYHIETCSRGLVTCDISAASLDTMISFRVV